MAYKLVWKSHIGKETIEENINSIEEAEFLKGEYSIAYHTGSIEIHDTPDEEGEE